MNLLLPLSLITSSSHFAGNLFGVINHNTSCDTPCHISLLADALMQQWEPFKRCQLLQPVYSYLCELATFP